MKKDVLRNKLDTIKLPIDKPDTKKAPETYDIVPSILLHGSRQALRYRRFFGLTLTALLLLLEMVIPQTVLFSVHSAKR